MKKAAGGKQDVCSCQRHEENLWTQADLNEQIECNEERSLSQSNLVFVQLVVMNLSKMLLKKVVHFVIEMFRCTPLNDQMCKIEEFF